MPNEPEQEFKGLKEELLEQHTEFEADLNRIEADLNHTKLKLQTLGMKLKDYLQAVNEHLKKSEKD